MRLRLKNTTPNTTPNPTPNQPTPRNQGWFFLVGNLSARHSSLLVLLVAPLAAALSSGPVGRRAVLLGATASLAPLPASAGGEQQAALFQEEEHNEIGDSSLFKPFVKVASKVGMRVRTLDRPCCGYYCSWAITHSG
jgi:hypothetical protein